MALFRFKFVVDRTKEDKIILSVLSSWDPPLSDSPVFLMMPKAADQKTDLSRITGSGEKFDEVWAFMKKDIDRTASWVEIRIYPNGTDLGDLKDEALGKAESATLYTRFIPLVDDARIPIPKKKGPRKLVDLVADSLDLADTVPRPGCAAALGKHKEWMDFLKAAYPAAGLFAKDVGTVGTIDPRDKEGKPLKDKDGKLVPGQTSCSVILTRALTNNGVPDKYLGTKAGTLIPHFNRLENQPYLFEITEKTLPRKGDPYFLYHPNPPQCHHAIFGSLRERKADGTYIINDYSGGQATRDSMDSTKDVGFYTRPLAQADKFPPPPVWPGAAAPLILLGGTGTSGVGEGLVRPVKWFVDMWAFLRDHGSDVNKLRDSL
jgi:hypothetical protein